MKVRYAGRAEELPGLCGHTVHPTPNILHPHPTPYTLHPHPTPYTLHPTPYTHTLHPTPYTLHPTRPRRRVDPRTRTRDPRTLNAEWRGCVARSQRREISCENRFNLKTICKAILATLERIIRLLFLNQNDFHIRLLACLEMGDPKVCQPYAKPSLVQWVYIQGCEQVVSTTSF